MPSTMKGMPSPSKTLAHPTTSPPKTTARRDPFHLDDPQYDEARMPQYLELSTQCLSAAASKEEERKAKRKQDAQLWAARQKANAELAAKEAAYQASLRKVDLGLIKTKVTETKESEMQKEQDVVTKTRKDQEEKRQTRATWESRQKVIVENEREFYGMEKTRWTKEAEAEAARQDKKKSEREAKAAETQQWIKSKQEAADKAAKAFAKRSKAELAAETKKQAEAEAKKDAERRKESSAQRLANINYAKTHSDRLHWEPPPSPVHIAQLAKDIREKTEIPTGK